jgi:hypothetical protein
VQLICNCNTNKGKDSRQICNEKGLIFICERHFFQEKQVENIKFHQLAFDSHKKFIQYFKTLTFSLLTDEGRLQMKQKGSEPRIAQKFFAE